VRACCHPCCPVRPPVTWVHKDPSPLQIVHPPSSVGPQVRPRHLPCSDSAAATTKTPSHCLSSLSRRYRSSAEARSCFSSLPTSIPDTGEALHHCTTGELSRRHHHLYSLQTGAPSLVTPVRRGPGAAAVKTSAWVGRRQAAPQCMHSMRSGQWVARRACSARARAQSRGPA
jgi:hypothetical protein